MKSLGIPAVAHRCTWDEPNLVQYHDKNNPLPDQWDDDPPDEIVALCVLIDAVAAIEERDREIKRLRESLSDMVSIVRGIPDEISDKAMEKLKRAVELIQA